MADTDTTLSVGIVLTLKKLLEGLGVAKDETTKAMKGIAGEAKLAPEVDTEAASTNLKSFGQTTAQFLKDLSDKLTVTPEVKPFRSIEALETQLHDLQSLAKKALTFEEAQGYNKQLQDTQKELSQVQAKLKGVEGEAGKSESKFGELGKTMLAAFGGAAIGASIAGIGEKVFEAGKEEAQQMDKLTLAFNGNKEAAEHAAETADKLASKYAIMPDRLKEISADAAITGGATGKFNDNLTELAGGLEKMKVPGLDATSVIKAFTLGAGDPEGAAGIGRLQKLMGPLAHELDGITDPAEKTRKALELLKPKFDELAANAQGSGEASEQVTISLDKFEKGLGSVFFNMIGTYVLPILKLFIDGLTSLGGWFEKLPGPVLTIAKVLGGLMLAVSGVTVAAIAYEGISKLSLVTKARQAIVDGLETVQKIAGTAAQWARNAAEAAGVLGTGLLTAATSALGVAVAVATSPVTLIVLAIAALAAGVYYAYNHFTAFHNLVDNIGAFLGGIWNATIKTVVEWWDKLVGFVQISVLAFKYFYNQLGPVKTAIDAVVGAVKSAVEWVENLFSSTEKLTTVQKEHIAQLDDEVKKQAALNAEIEKENKLRKSQTDAYDAFNQKLQDQRAQAEKMANSLTEQIAEGDTSPILKQRLQEYLDTATAVNKKLQEVADHEQANHDRIDGKDEQNKPKEKTKKTLSQDIKAGVDAAREANQLGIDDYAKTTAKLVELSKDRRLILKKDSGGNVVDSPENRERLKATEEVNKALESLHSEQVNILKKAYKVQGKDLELHLSESKEKYEGDIADLQKALDKKLITQDQFQQFSLDAESSYRKAIIALVRASSDQADKVELDALKSKFDERLKTEEAQAVLLGKNVIDVKKKNATDYQAADAALVDQQMERAIQIARQTITNEQDLQAETAQIIAAGLKKKADLKQTTNDELLKLDTEQINQDKEIADRKANAIKSQYDRELQLAKDKFDAENALLDLALKAGTKTHEQSEEERTTIAGDYALQRTKITQTEVQRVEALEASLTKSIESLTAAALQNLKVSLGLAHKEKEKVSTADLALYQVESKKSIATLAEEVRTNKISYQEYVLKKAQMDQDLLDKQQQFADEHQSQLQKAAKEELTTIIDSSAKKMAVAIQDAATEEAISLAKGQVGAVAWLFTTFGPIVGAALSGVAILALQEIFSKITGKREGGYGGDGPEDQIAGVYHGKEYIVNASDTRKLGGPGKIDQMLKGTDPSKAFEQHLMTNVFTPAQGASFQRNLQYPTVPPLAKSLQNYGGSSMSPEDRATMKSFTKAIKKISSEGITTHVKTDFTLKGQNIHGALRSYGKSVSQRSATVGGGTK